MTETADRLEAVFGADLTGLQSGVAAAQRMLQGFTNNVQSIGANMARLGANMTLLTAPIAAWGATGVKTAADFESLMTQIKVFGGVAGKEFDTVRDFVLKMGADTVFSAQDAGGAMLDMLKAGLSLKDAMAGLPTVLELATVGNLSLTESSGIVTAAMAQYHLKAKDATRITDALAKAANASRADVRDLGQAMGNVGPIAAQFGLEYEDTTAILAVFANNGIMGAEAGTQLKSVLLNLSSTTKKTQKAYKDLGISLYDANGNMKDMDVFIADLDRALDKLPVQSQNKLMKDLGGSYGILGLSALRSAGGIKEMRKAMKAAPGSGKVAAASMGTFSRSLESLSGSIETLQITVLTPFIENTLKPMVDRFIQITNAATEWAKANPELAGTITKIVAGLTTLGPILLTAGLAIGAIGSILGAIVSPIGLVIAGVAALGAAFATNFLGIRDLAMKFIEFFRPFFDQVIRSIGYFIEDVKKFGLLDAVLGAFGLGKSGAAAGGQSWLEGLLRTFVQGVEKAIPEILKGIEKLLTSIGNFIGENAPKVLKAFSELLGKVGDWMKGDGPKQVLEGLGGFIKSVAEWFANSAWPFLKTGVEQLWGMIKTFIESDGVSRFIEGLVVLVGKAVNWLLTTAVPELLKGVMGLIVGVVDWVKTGGAEKFIQGLKTAIEGMIKWLLEKGIPMAVDAFSKLVNAVGKELERIVDKLLTPIRDGLRSMGIMVDDGKTTHYRQKPTTGGSASFGGAMSAARGGGLTKAFASGGPTGSRPGLGLFHPNEFVVPERGALVMKSGGGGYSGPGIVRVQLYTDRLIDEIDVNLAAAMAGG